MPLPASYTEGTLLALLETEVGPIGVALGLLTSDALLEAVNDTVGILGHDLSEETTVAGVMKVRAIGIWRAWLAAWSAALGSVDLKAGTVSLAQSQRVKHIRERLMQAEAQASIYDEVAVVLSGSSTAYVSEMATAGSPYSYAYDEWS